MCTQYVGYEPLQLHGCNRSDSFRKEPTGCSSVWFRAGCSATSPMSPTPCSAAYNTTSSVNDKPLNYQCMKNAFWIRRRPATTWTAVVTKKWSAVYLVHVYVSKCNFLGISHADQETPLSQLITSLLPAICMAAFFDSLCGTQWWATTTAGDSAMSWLVDSCQTKLLLFPHK